MTPLPGLEHHRTRAGLSRRNLAQRAGLSYETVRRFEQEDEPGGASAYSVQVLAGALGVDERALLGAREAEGEPLWARWRAQVARLEGLLANEGGQR